MRKVNTSYKRASELNKHFEQFEIKHEIEPNDRTIIVRLDGHDLTKVFKQNECFDRRLYDTMYKISNNIIKYFSYIVRTYSFKDEISIQIDYAKLSKDKYYGNKEEKLLSILSGYVSSMFNKYNNIDDIYSFDARILYLPNDLVDSYFKARESFSTYSYLECIYNYYKLEGYKEKHFSIRKVLDHEDIKQKDLKEYLCYGVSGKFDGDKWKVSPKQSKRITDYNKKS